ncbi:MAG: tripartite tricarboxylate transporter substrate binding protein [Roseococcus sp.]
MTCPILHALRHAPGRRALLLGLGAGLAAPCLPRGAAAQGGWRPARPVRIIVPYTPGGITDIAARLLAANLQESLGQSFVVENRAGGGTIVGTEAVARAPGDGHTLLLTGAPFATNVTLAPRLPYDPVRDFVPVTLVVSNPLVLVVHPGVEARTLGEFLALARARPGAMQLGSGGNGTLPHMATELLSREARAEITHVPYRGGSAAVADVVAGTIPGMFDNPSSAIPQIRAGRFRALAVSGAARSPALPDVPTIAEAANLPGFEVVNWFGLFAPGTTPPELVQAIHAAFAAELRSDRVRERFAADGVTTGGNSPQEFAAFVRAETAKWGEIIRERNIRAD